MEFLASSWFQIFAFAGVIVSWILQLKRTEWELKQTNTATQNNAAAIQKVEKIVTNGLGAGIKEAAVKADAAALAAQNVAAYTKESIGEMKQDIHEIKSDLKAGLYEHGKSISEINVTLASLGERVSMRDVGHQDDRR